MVVITCIDQRLRVDYGMPFRHRYIHKVTLCTPVMYDMTNLPLNTSLSSMRLPDVTAYNYEPIHSPMSNCDRVQRFAVVFLVAWDR